MSLFRDRNNTRNITAEDLSAFSDGELMPERARAVAGFLRRNPAAAKQVYEAWCLEGDLLGQLSDAAEIPAEDASESCGSIESQRGKEWGNWSPAPWLGGMAAGVLFALGLWVGSLDGSSAGAGVGATPSVSHVALGEQIRPDVGAAQDFSGGALVPVSAAAPETEVPDLDLPSQPLNGPSSPQSPSGDELLPQQDLLPKSQHPASESVQLHFQSGDGQALTLERFSLDPSANTQSFEQPSLEAQGAPGAQDGKVHWIQAGNLYVLSGNVGAAGLFAVALNLREQQGPNGVLGAVQSRTAPRSAEAIPGATAGVAAETAPGFSKM
ncbi:hypothetical protein [uncultured Microbulbifer sp.]|uniref:anti-sigma factor family protein n=1 Tax=uncultured Microbulbifer sp. TaxID=348147 RepID=UPI00261CD596|nr:hypothetical protein [uncultured Microbulbifer sp.]